MAIPESETAWKEFFDTRTFVSARGANFRVLSAGGDGGVTFFMLHGAGHSAMTFALLARQMKSSVRVVAFDMRGHGETTADDETDMSADSLVEDAVAVAAVALAGAPHVVVLGHSMGGAIATRAAASGRIGHLAGLVVLDLVEGSAMAALPSMNAILSNMPASFPDLQHAIAWNIGTGSGSRNMESAAVAVPAQLRRDGDRLVWRTNLRATERHWRSWFEGLSDMFLRVPVPRLLILAGTDRLDKPLMIGQMQGKFQVKLMPSCGHLIHEDEPAEIASALTSFAQRYAQPVKLPPKK